MNVKVTYAMVFYMYNRAFGALRQASLEEVLFPW